MIEDPTWVASRAAGLARLRAFLPRAGRDYQSQRNHDLGPGAHVHVSGLSPYLRHRLLLDGEVLAAVLRGHSAAQAQKFIDEVFWRSYFKGWLEAHPGVWEDYTTGLERLLLQLQDDDQLMLNYRLAIEGATGIGPFDSWVRELVANGYLHNHARMWFASIWIFTLGLPWQLGAAWFHYHLLDGDAAANTLSWRWVAGLHTKGKTYLARPDNIRRYAGERIVTEAAVSGLERLAKVAPALQEDASITEWRAPRWPELTEAGVQIGSGERCGLLLHDEDLGLLSRLPLTAVAVLSPQRIGRSRAASAVARFGLSACQDTLMAARDIPSVENTPLLVRSNHVLRRWLEQASLDTLLVPYCPAGPNQARVAAACAGAEANGVRVHVFMRDLDRAAWPYANAGFFKLRKRIPQLLELVTPQRDLFSDTREDT